MLLHSTVGKAPLRRHLQENPSEGARSVAVQVQRPPAESSRSGEVSRLFSVGLQQIRISDAQLHCGEQFALLQAPLKNTLTETPRIMFDQTSGHRGPAKLRHKISHPME